MAICHALGDFRSGGHGAGPQDFNLGDFVTASVDGGNISSGLLSVWNLCGVTLPCCCVLTPGVRICTVC